MGRQDGFINKSGVTFREIYGIIFIILQLCCLCELGIPILNFFFFRD